MTVLVTGAAGFIGYHLCESLLRSDREVLGIDDMNPYYDPSLKEARLSGLRAHKGFRFHQIDISDRKKMIELADRQQDITHVVHLAAQAGVRYSLENPYRYIESNVMGHLVVMEVCRRLSTLRHLVYASSSSVYGANAKLPFSVDDPVDQPISLYAATKRSNELMAETYCHLYRIPMTGLRFFTVYGPWGRPDMAAFIFTKAIFEGRPIQVFNNGNMKRDFTYIDDIIDGILAAMNRPPVDKGITTPHHIYNLGNHSAEELTRFIELLEEATGQRAIKEFRSIQPGDVEHTCAEITRSTRDLDFEPKTSIEEGIPKFVKWFREYHRL